MSDAEAAQPQRVAPRVLDSGRIEPTVADMVFVALNTPGFAGATGINLCIWSDPGHGKTKTVEDVVKWAGRKPYGLVLTRVAPEDMTGIPFRIEVFVDANGAPLGADATEAEKASAEKRVFTVKAPDLQFVNIARDPQAVIIFDDATNSTPAVQAAALDILLEKKFSDGTGKTISLKHVPMVLMANHGEGASLTPLLSPVANRMVHIWMTTRDVLMWWRARRVSQVSLNIDKTKTLAKNWPALEAKAWDLVNDYIIEKGIESDKVEGSKKLRLDQPWSIDRDLPSNSKSEYGKEVFDTPTPQEFENVESYAFATSRSWEFAIRWIAACEHYGIDDTRGIVGAVGVEKAKPFLEWRRTRELVGQVFANKVDWSKLQPSEQNRVSLEAARRFTSDEQLGGMLASFKKLAKLCEGSEDVYRPAREHLLNRALGKAEPAITVNQIFLIRSQWPERFRQMAGPADDRALGAA